MNRHQYGLIATWRRTAIGNPIAVIRHFRGQSSGDALVFGAARHLFRSELNSDAWKQACAELDRSDFIPPASSPPVGNTHGTSLGRWLYALVRAMRPEVVVETGVAHGASSWLILNALHKNGAGMLHSIDLPDRDTNAPYNVGRSRTGSAVPAELRDRWNLIVGDSAEELPRLLATLGRVQLFFHDSDHSYDAMRREFSAVLPYLDQGGVLVSDDVQKNAAFIEICRQAWLRAYIFRKGGAARLSAGSTIRP